MKDGFAEFAASFPRQGNARRVSDAYAAALAAGATPEALNTGAKRYAAERKTAIASAADREREERHTIGPERWLSEGKWKSHLPAVMMNGGGKWVDYDTPKWDAWRAYYLRTKGHAPNPIGGGRFFPSEWPPETEVKRNSDERHH
jgi:hypothetical protein